MAVLPLIRSLNAKNFTVEVYGDKVLILRKKPVARKGFGKRFYLILPIKVVEVRLRTKEIKTYHGRYMKLAKEIANNYWGADKGVRIITVPCRKRSYHW